MVERGDHTAADAAARHETTISAERNHCHGAEMGHVLRALFAVSTVSVVALRCGKVADGVRHQSKEPWQAWSACQGRCS